MPPRLLPSPDLPSVGCRPPETPSVTSPSVTKRLMLNRHPGRANHLVQESFKPEESYMLITDVLDINVNLIWKYGILL
jgi:hypothetical protein